MRPNLVGVDGNFAKLHLARLYRVDTKGKSGDGVLSPKQQCPAEGSLEYEIIGCGISVHNPITRTGST